MRDDKTMNETPSFGSNLVVAWTGHREIPNENVVARAVETVLDRLATMRGDRLLAIGSIAIGADTIVAEAVVRRDIPLSVVLPYEIQRFESEATGSARHRVHRLYDAAKSVRYISPQPSDDEAFFAASEVMLEHADLLIAIIDPERPASRVGAKAVRDLARKRGIQVIAIDARNGEFEFESVAQAIDGPPIRNRKRVLELFLESDSAAANASKPVRSTLFWIIILHLAASAIAVAQLVFEDVIESHVDSHIASVVKIASLAIAVGLAWRGRSKHRAWTHTRVCAELCRSFLALWDMPRNSIMLPLAPTAESAKIRQELELAWLCDVPAPKDFERVRAAYIEKMPADKSDPANPNGRVKEQMDYFSTHHRRASEVGHGLDLGASISTGIAILAGIVALVLALVHEEGGSYLISKAMSLCLPLVSAAMLSYVTSLDLGRRSNRYLEMRQKCKECRERCAGAETWHALGRAVSELEWLFLAELGEWHAFNRHAGALH